MRVEGGLTKKALIVSCSRTGNSEKMAEYTAEGIRFSGHQADLKQVSEVKSERLSGLRQGVSEDIKDF